MAIGVGQRLLIIKDAPPPMAKPPRAAGPGETERSKPHETNANVAANVAPHLKTLKFFFMSIEILLDTASGFHLGHQLTMEVKICQSLYKIVGS